MLWSHCWVFLAPIVPPPPYWKCQKIVRVLFLCLNLSSSRSVRIWLAWKWMGWEKQRWMYNERGSAFGRLMDCRKGCWLLWHSKNTRHSEYFHSQWLRSSKRRLSARKTSNSVCRCWRRWVRTSSAFSACKSTMTRWRSASACAAAWRCRRLPAAATQNLTPLPRRSRCSWRLSTSGKFDRQSDRAGSYLSWEPSQCAVVHVTGWHQTRRGGSSEAETRFLTASSGWPDNHLLQVPGARSSSFRFRCHGDREPEYRGWPR